MLVAGKNSLTILVKYFRQKLRWKKIDREMLIRTLLTIILERFYEIILHLQVIIKSIKNPDNNFKSSLSKLMG